MFMSDNHGTQWNIEERCYISKRFAVCCHVQSTVHRLPIAQHVLRQKFLEGCFKLFCLKPVFYDHIQEVQKVIWKIVIFLIEWGCQLKISWSNSSIFRWGNIKRRQIWNIWVFIVFKLNPVWTGWHPETDEAGSSYLLLIQLRIKSYTWQQ